MTISDRPLAYCEHHFIDSDDARPVRILAEYLAPLAAFQRARVHDTISFFGSSRISEDGPMQRYYADARRLARMVTAWSRAMPTYRKRLLVCSGGAGGIMESVSRGARDAGGRAIGLNIGLPHEQRPNAYLDPELTFEFHYFFMRKLWFAHLARAVVVFPGGFGTLDELFEILTLSQTRKLDREIFLILYGSEYWHEIINFEALVKHGVIGERDLALIHFADAPDAAFHLLQRGIGVGDEVKSPAFAKSTIAP